MFLTFETRAFFVTMSKTKLIKFIKTCEKEELEEQLLDLYLRFKEVKEFYDFSFNPNEQKRVEEAKLKIAREYFPEGKRKPKKRRSVAQKHIDHLKKLEVEASQIIDLMLYNIEIAQAYNAEKPIAQEAFYKSMLSSFRKALVAINQQFLKEEFLTRVEKIEQTAADQKWINAEGFKRSIKDLLEN
tara:strand:- start:160 stop:717 length:558 start_codon:yes stop_codon:yes gene_type:complete